MPIKKDDAGNRWVEMEFLIQGTPEEVWHAMATGPGNTAWFTCAEIEEQEGGALRFDFGANGATSGEVTSWEPPHRFGYVERDWNAEAPPVATEIVITSRGDGQCIVRMVHSLFTSSEDWDDQLEGFESGWPGFFDVLRVYLAHFAGWTAASFIVLGSAGRDHPTAWRRLTEALDIAGANVGEARTTPPSPESLSVVVERVHQDVRQRYLVMRLEAPAPGIALLGTYGDDKGVTASLNLYHYGDGSEVASAASERRWQAWFAENFPPR